MHKCIFLFAKSLTCENKTQWINFIDHEIYDLNSEASFMSVSDWLSDESQINNESFSLKWESSHDD